ncbi:MAG: hypothetical protein AAF429_08745 [Pseudomonadota bacterium]
MGNLITLFIRMPWYGYLLLAIGAGYLGMTMAEDSQKRAALIEAAIAQDAPQQLSLADYTHPETKFAEANLRMQWVPARNTELVKRRNGVRTDTNFMVAFTDVDAVQEPDTYRALMILDKKEWDKMEDWLTESVVGFGALGPIVEVMGVVSRRDGESSHARDALKNKGKAMASDKIFITPYFEGREAGLQNLAANAQRGTSSNLFQNVTVFLVILAIAKLAYRLHLKRRRTARVAQAQAEAQTQFATAQRPVAQPAQNRRAAPPIQNPDAPREIPQTVKRF